MTLAETTLEFAALARTKVAGQRQNPVGFLITSMMAGTYVGIGILLIFSVGQNVDPSVRNLVMGCSFGIALTLVVFAGSELFTGHTIYITLGLLAGATTPRDLARGWPVTWLGNLVGCILLAILFVLGGGGEISKDGADLLHVVAIKKMTSPAIELVARAILCNWLVCLAIWTAARTTNDAAKCILIFWCLFASIASGFEHSVANMTIFAVALLSEHPNIRTSGRGELCRRGTQPVVGDDRQCHQRGCHHGLGLLDRQRPSATRPGGRLAPATRSRPSNQTVSTVARNRKHPASCIHRKPASLWDMATGRIPGAAH